MAIRAQIAITTPTPTDAEATAIETVAAYLTHAASHVASHVVGRPVPTGEVAALANLSNPLLTRAALCPRLRASGMPRIGLPKITYPLGGRRRSRRRCPMRPRPCLAYVPRWPRLGGAPAGPSRGILAVPGPAEKRVRVSS